MHKVLHIVCLDVPYPPDYGGAIDMFYKIVALHAAGVKIHLHYFSYNHRGNPNELNQYCESIHVYERKTGLKGFSLSIPYIVSSRNNTELLKRLSKDDFPVLLEGIHCSHVAKYLHTEKRKVVVRLHNEESIYYDQLATHESNFVKKLYFRNESRLLKYYQQGLPKNITYAALNRQDIDIFRNEYGLQDTIYLPAFIPYQQILCKEGLGHYCLYHGNLSVSENEKAACWLIEQIFAARKIPLVIAGKNPSAQLQKKVQKYDHVCLVINPTTAEMNDLIQKAQINILPSFNATGIKLKLLQSVFAGRHCIVNQAMVKDTGLASACHIADDKTLLQELVLRLFETPFTQKDIADRSELMEYHYNNAKNAERLMTWIW